MKPQAGVDPQRSPTRSGRLRARLSGRTRSVAVGAMIAVVGITASALIANERRTTLTQSNSRAFQLATAQLADTIDAKLDSTIAVTRAMRAIAAMEPGAGESRYLRWYGEILKGAGSATRGVDAVLIQPVPAARLAAFERSQLADPAFARLARGRYSVIPAGRRAVYCLARAVVGPSQGSSVYPVGLDYCDPKLPGLGRSPYAGLINTVTDTGSFIVSPVAGSAAAGTTVAVGAAVYRSGAPIATVAQRRAAVTGFIATTFDSTALLRSVLPAAQRSITVALYHSNAGGPLVLVGRVGANPTGRSPGELGRAEVAGGWLVEVTGTAAGSVSASTEALVVFAIGVLVTLLVFLLYRVLSLSRQRAWGLVGEKTEELEFRALHDPLTGLPNRALVLDRAEQVLARARRLDIPVTALFMDIDGFKQINDRLGHHGGDEVLREVGARLRRVLRGSDTIGRLGGDEFVIVLDCTGPESAHPDEVAERILTALEQPFELADTKQLPISVSASIGIATALPPSADDLLQEADIAMYQAKAAGKGGYVVFESAMEAAVADRIQLEMDLGDALTGDQLFLDYQPVMNLETEQVVGAEALVRWQHPTRGVIAPDGFIPIAEASGAIVPLGRWVLRHAVAQCAAWRAKGHPLGISVNVSARQFERAEFVEEVREALADAGLEPSSLTLEISEATLMRRPATTQQLLGELKTLGVQIAIDDFGTGYGSFGYLREFPIDALKIDRSYISALAPAGVENALAHTLIQLGKRLGLRTHAEGVEKPNQLAQLQREGCDLAQGFLFAHPLTPEALESFLERSSSSSSSSRKPSAGALSSR